MAPATNFLFDNHFHPFVGALVEKLNQQSVAGLLDLTTQSASVDFFKEIYKPNDQDSRFKVQFSPKNIDVGERGPYSVYNWELFFHAPITIAVHLSKNQRFAEAQRWFHFVFNPTDTDPNAAFPQDFWKFIRFRRPQPEDMPRVDRLVDVLSKATHQLSAEDQKLLAAAAVSYEQVRRNPFQPHAVARTRVVAYQYYVVMKYIDNLIAWGDSLFRLDTAESISEATQLYVLAGNILGPSPLQVPRTAARRMSYRQLVEATKKSPSDPDHLPPFGNIVVELENQLPFAQTPLPGAPPGGNGAALLGIGRTLYFCVPRNDQLVGYWDTVADRLSKIRSCRDITGTARKLSLFAPALDPGLLSRATAAGIDVAGAVAGTYAPASPVRATSLMAKATEIVAEVKSAGAALLSAMERRDAEQLARLRQRHEVDAAQFNRDVRFLGWKEAEANTEALLRSRAATFARYQHFQLLLGREQSDIDQLRNVTIIRPDVTEENFNEVHQRLVGHFGGSISEEIRPAPRLAGVGDPQVQAGAQSQGSLGLIANEFAELNIHLPRARDKQQDATNIDIIFGVLGMLPVLGLNFMPIGIGGHLEHGGQLLSSVGRTLSAAVRGGAEQDNYEAVRAAKIAGYQRRDLDFVHQSNQAAFELMQNGRALIASLLHEQVARHDYNTSVKQIARAQEVDVFLASKDTGTELYTWLTGEVARSFAESYRTAVDVARTAEQAVKRELMLPELDSQSFIGFSHWETGRHGLQAGERLHHDLTRLQLSYLEHRRREFELTTHVSLRMLDPIALLRLRSIGQCDFIVPEWLLDLEAPGHYARRIRSVALSLPAVTGPYTSVKATLSLQRSSIRTQPTLIGNKYSRVQGEDPRFADYPGALQAIVTSSAIRDTGMFDPVDRDDRYLPFEGAGAISSWALSLPTDLRTFDYTTISDAVLHINYTARPGLTPTVVTDDLRQQLAAIANKPLIRALSLRHDFPSEWATFISDPRRVEVQIPKLWFPYFVQNSKITVHKVELWGIAERALVQGADPVAGDALPVLNAELADKGHFTLAVPNDGGVVRPDAKADPYLLVQYTIT